MKKYSKLDVLLIKLRNKFRHPLGTVVYVRKSEQFPRGFVGRVISHNTFECEYQVTSVINPEINMSNPYILESNDGFKVSQEEFDNTEFIHYADAEVIDLEAQSQVVKFLQGPVAKLVLGVLLFCSGGLVALEFLK